MLKCSVIIGHRNDKVDLLATLESLFRYNDDVIGEVLIVDDCSDDVLCVSDIFDDIRIRVIRARVHMGIGRAFDIGVSQSLFENVFLMGSDIRFDSNNAIRQMIECSIDNPKSIVGCRCHAVASDIEFRKVSSSIRCGAEIKWTMTNEDLSISHQYKRDILFRDILQAKWLKDERQDVYQIPCVLGATYATNKTWYEYIRGFEGHKMWGGLEPYISLKSYLAGGDCLLIGDVWTGHRFNRSIDRQPDIESYYYNKVFMAYMLFNGELQKHLLDHVRVKKPAIQADEKIRKEWYPYYASLKEYYRNVLTTDIRDTICYNSFG